MKNTCKTADEIKIKLRRTRERKCYRRTWKRVGNTVQEGKKKGERVPEMGKITQRREKI